ncbi:MAG: ComEA family DNA-binding protein [Actinobacteria bacterium]|nr:ComEA family DNA-binding protein [Actinomycetota bacterium]MCZ6566769.1 ComEA family DNA-binding protein [Actinomycetota bacterium]MCZ6737668.1 ComEA family DNA-binding protein [Actinomycetota bacterium]
MSRAVAVVAVVGAAVLVGGSLGSLDRPQETVRATESNVEIVKASIDVHVAGWVVSPGVVRVAPASIVADAIEAAGGLRPGALVDRINLAAPLRSGDQIVVPGPGALVESSEGGLLALNRASANDLEGLPGVGPVLAERIVAYREQNGPFTEVEDLLQVGGIGEAKLASIRDLVRIP